MGHREVSIVQRLREDLDGVMTEIRKVPGVTAVGIVRRDGIVIDELLPRSVDARKVGAMAATIVGTAEMVVQELSQGTFQQSIIESENGKIISIGAGVEAILVALVKPEANLGLALMTMEKQASKVSDFLATL